MKQRDTALLVFPRQANESGNRRNELNRPTAVVHLPRLRHTCSGPSVTTCCLLCRCTLGIYSRPIYHKYMPLCVTFLFLSSLSVGSTSIHRLPLLALMIHLLSINQFLKLSNYHRATGSPRKSICQRSWRCSIVRPVTSCPPGFKTRWWTSVVKITQVNNNHLSGYMCKTGARRRENKKPYAYSCILLYIQISNTARSINIWTLTQFSSSSKE